MVAWTDEQVKLIKNTVAKGATNDELQLFLYGCKQRGLDPLRGQVVFNKFNSKDGPKIAFITTIDALRLIAARSGCHAGTDKPIFTGETPEGYPEMCEVTVHKIVQGQKVAFHGETRWKEFYPGEAKGFQWRKMPHVMLAKTAEAAALRRAFPEELAGNHVEEEQEVLRAYENDLADKREQHIKSLTEPQAAPEEQVKKDFAFVVRTLADSGTSYAQMKVHLGVDDDWDWESASTETLSAYTNSLKELIK